MRGVTASPQAYIAVQRHGHSLGRRISAVGMAIGTYVFVVYQTMMQVSMRSRPCSHAHSLHMLLGWWYSFSVVLYTSCDILLYVGNRISESCIYEGPHVLGSRNVLKKQTLIVVDYINLVSSKQLYICGHTNS